MKWTLGPLGGLAGAGWPMSPQPEYHSSHPLELQTRAENSKHLTVREALVSMQIACTHPSHPTRLPAAACYAPCLPPTALPVPTPLVPSCPFPVSIKAQPAQAGWTRLCPSRAAQATCSCVARFTSPVIRAAFTCQRLAAERPAPHPAAPRSASSCQQEQDSDSTGRPFS